jgi:hypothetical protein
LWGEKKKERGKNAMALFIVIISPFIFSSEILKSRCEHSRLNSGKWRKDTYPLIFYSSQRTSNDLTSLFELPLHSQSIIESYESIYNISLDRN